MDFSLTFFIQSILIFPPPSTPQISLPPYPPNFVFYLTTNTKAKKTKLSQWEKTTTKWNKQKKNNLANYSWTWWPALDCGWYIQSIVENWFSLCQLAPITNSFLIRSGTLRRSYTCCHSVFEFMCAQPYCLWKTLLPWSYPPSLHS